MITMHLLSLLFQIWLRVFCEKTITAHYDNLKCIYQFFLDLYIANTKVMRIKMKMY